MTLSIRNPEADALAKRLAKLDGATVTEAVIAALREAIAARVKRESPSETARKILARHGLSFPKIAARLLRKPTTTSIMI